MTEEKLGKKILAIFKDLHQHPELSAQEFVTTKKIRQWLKAQSITLRETHLPTGVFAEITGDSDGPVVGLRADIDALPIHEQTNLSYKSQIDGVMHACGHDFHTSALLWAAYLLKEKQTELPGTVRLIFQPAEEAEHGGLQVIRDGQLAGLDAVIGIHNKPDLPVGTIGIKSGPLMAACDKYKITFQGIGGHAAIPERTKDPVIASSSFIQTVQTIVSRNISPKHEAVVSVTSIHGGDVWNVIPGKVELLGTVRTFYDEDRELIINRFREITEGLEKVYGVKVNVAWGKGTPSVLNDENLTRIVKKANQTEVNVVVPELSVAGDDFSCFQREVPGVFAFVGSNGPEDWHHPSFQVDPAGIQFAAGFYFRSALAVLKALEKEKIH